MIKVIQHGKRVERKTIYTITCPNCGCVFEAEPSDCALHSRCMAADEDFYATIFCPDCHNSVVINNKTQRREEVTEAPYYESPTAATYPQGYQDPSLTSCSSDPNVKYSTF